MTEKQKEVIKAMKPVDPRLCVKEIVQVLVKHSVVVGDLELVLDSVKEEILSSTPVRGRLTKEPVITALIDKTPICPQENHD